MKTNQVLYRDAAGNPLVTKSTKPMPTQNTDKATARPWRIAPEPDERHHAVAILAPWESHEGEPHHPLIAQCCRGKGRGIPTEVADANAALICQAVNEREALLAVAEAAKAVSTSRNEVPRHRKLMDKWLDDALSALAKIQGGKQ